MPRRSGGDLNGWWRLGIALVGPVAALLFRIRVLGADRVPRGAAVVAANHISPLDGVLLGIATGRTARRMTRFLAAAEFFHGHWFSWVLRFYRQIPVRRGGRDAGALDRAVSTAAAGALVGIFPEGRVNPRPEAGLERGHTGVARIAIATSAPVVPVGIWGTQHRWSRAGLSLGRPLRPVVALAYGEAVAPHGDPSSVADLEAFTAEVMRAIEAQVRIAREVAGRDQTG